MIVPPDNSSPSENFSLNSISLEVIKRDARRTPRDDLITIGLRCMAVRGTTSIAALSDLLAVYTADLEEVDFALDAIFQRGDAIQLSVGGKAVLAPVRRRRYSLAGQSIDVGASGSMETVNPGNDAITLTKLLGPASWRMSAGEPLHSSDLPKFLQSISDTGSDSFDPSELSAWRYLAASDDIAAVISGNLAHRGPSQFHRLSLLTQKWSGEARKRLIPAVRSWAGLPEQESGTLDSAQLEVARREPSARTLVIAPPGAGKTHTILARISELIDADCSPTKILTLSFTRNAVQTLRSRLRRVSEGSDVGVLTLDALAGQLAGNSQATSFDQTIRTATARVSAGDADCLGWLDGREHVIIDEAQDIVGVRRKFLLALIDNLPQRCGVTLFCDPSQSIYGFQDAITTPIADAIGSCSEFQTHELMRNYRSSDAGLRAIASEGRRFLLSEDVTEGNESLTAIRTLILDHASGTPPNITDPLDQPDMALFRWTGDMIHHAAHLSKNGKRYELRGGRMGREDPAIAPGWFGAAILMQEGNRSSGLSLFEKAFSSDPTIPRGDDLTALLKPALLHGKYNHAAAAEALLQGRAPGMRPPNRAVTLSTIHAAKGLEADNVTLYLQRHHTDDADQAEEGRILYVGATRARQRLWVAMASGSTLTTKHKRHWIRERYSAFVHVSAWDAQNSVLADGVDPLEFAKNPTMPSPLLEWNSTRRRWSLGTSNDQGEIIITAWMPEAFTNDISEIAKVMAPDRPFIPRCEGNAHVRSGTVVSRDGIAIIPVIEGFFRLRFGKSSIL